MKDYRYIIALLLLCFSYYLLFGAYRPAEIDDAWTASYVWALTHNHNTDDTVFGAPSNIRYFGHIHAYLAGRLADIFGWSKVFFHSYNLLCMFGAFLAWALTASKMLKNVRLALLCVALCFMLESFLGGVYKARSDAMAFFVTAVSVCVAAHRHFFVAALLCSIAVEIHPVAATGYFQIASFAVSDVMKTKDHKLLLLRAGACATGCLLGFCVYCFIHPEPLREIVDYLGQSNSVNKFFNALGAHYFQRAYFRFVPELLFIVVGAGIYAYRNKKITLADPVTCLFVMTFLSSLIIRRDNFHYVIFFYPPLILFSALAYEKCRILNLAAGCLAIYALTLSLTLYWQNRHVDHAAFDQSMQAVPLTKRELPIIGPTNAWFVLKDRRFYASFAAMRKGESMPPKRIYYIQSVYSEPVPACLRYIGSVGGDFVFNAKMVRTFEMDLSPCE